MSAVGDVTLAAVWHPNPDRPITWAMFFGALIVVVGTVIALIGVFAAFDTWRKSEPPRGRTLRVVLVTGGFFLAAGLAIAALGVWVY